MASTGTFTNYPRLKVALPPLVRKQRRLIAKIVTVAQEIKDEKVCREQIDTLLVAAGLKKSDVVTCNGYDVRHNERDGQESLNADKITEQLIAAGVAEEFIAKLLMDSTDTGEIAKFATVTPSKGAKVRA